MNRSILIHWQLATGNWTANLALLVRLEKWASLTY